MQSGKVFRPSVGRPRRGARLALMVAAMTLVLVFVAGCSLGGKAAQGVLSGVLDKATGGAVKLDEGGITITGDDGETIGLAWDGGSVPDGFPSVVPDDWAIVGSLEFQSEGRRAWSGTIGAEGTAEMNVQLFKQRLASMGFRVVETDEIPDDADTEDIDFMDVFNVTLFEGVHGGEEFKGHAVFLEPAEDSDGDLLMVQLTVIEGSDD